MIDNIIDFYMRVPMWCAYHPLPTFGISVIMICVFGLLYRQIRKG